MPKDAKEALSNDIGLIKNRFLEREMQESYLDYAMSVIVSRALPDVRDGLKPVHRRILYAMHEMGLRHNVKFRKSAAVVGDVLGKYHPHGDIAVYDSMVHMAQDFAMRYPLIDGQGNFGCFTGDTKVALTDGRDLSFIELVKEYKNGKINYTYAFNHKAGLIEIVQIKNPRLTKKRAQLIEVELDSGDKIRCTPNHLFMLRDGNYKESRNLASGDSLMPAYFRLSTPEDDKNAVGYRMVWQPFQNFWDWAHRLADKHNLENGKYKINAGKVRHHLDFNKLNNNPNNIKRMQWGDHWRLHYNLTSEKHKNDPEYVLKLKKGREKYWNNPENIKKRAKLMSARNSKNWQNFDYREKMRTFLSQVNKEFIKNHPEKRKELSLRATATLKRLWQNPVYRSLMHDKIVKGNKNHRTNRTGKLKFLNVCRKLVENKVVLNEENYQKIRNAVYPYGSAPVWNTGLKYFQNSANLILNELNGNHKVIKINQVSHTEDVYDLTIENFHNFALANGIFVHNSMDGDGAAAMRYTESRMSAPAEEILLDLDKDTVDWRDNYDATRKEPSVMPGKLPNLLLNGTLGIAVGMATDIPPHNLTEVCDAITALIDDPESTTEDLLEFVKGPDFPTGGIIYDVTAIKNAYATGKGSIVMRAKTEITETKTGAFQILVHEIPYRVNKATLLEKIAQLVSDKKIEGIRDVRDESDKDGVRIVIEVKKDGLPNKILNQLFSFTQLQETFHMNMLALVDGIEPHVLNLKTVLEKYLEHRQVVIKRRTEFELKKAKERAHILEGLKKALDNIDAIISTIKKSPTKEEARVNLVKKFKLTEIQADAILEMRLQTLAGLERKKIDEELKEKKLLIAELEKILSSKKLILGIIKKEVLEMKEKYGDERRTQVVKNALGTFSAEDLIPESNVIITITKSGYVKRLAPDTYKSQARGGKGVIGQTLKEEDVVDKLISSNTHDDILFFTNRGRVFQTKVYELPEGSRVSKGQALVNFLQLQNNETAQAVMTFTKKDNAKFFVMATKKGLIKKTARDEFSKVRKSGMIAITLKGDDELMWVETSLGDDQIMLSTENGQAIRFSEKDVRPMGRNASGVTGMRLKKGDKIISMDVIKKEINVKDLEVLVVTENGLGKKTDATYYKVQKRSGSGIKTLKVTPKTGKIVAMYILNNKEEHDLVIISKAGQTIRTPLNSVSTLGRATQGVRVMRLDEGDKVASATII